MVQGEVNFLWHLKKFNIFLSLCCHSLMAGFRIPFQFFGSHFPLFFSFAPFLKRSYQGSPGGNRARPGETAWNSLAKLGPTWPSLTLGYYRKAFFILTDTKTGRNSCFSICPKPILKQNKTFCFGQNYYYQNYCIHWKCKKIITYKIVIKSKYIFEKLHAYL